MAIGEFDGFDRASTCSKGQANQQQTCLTCARVPSGHIDEEVRGGFCHCGVVAIDDGWEGKDAICGIDNDGEFGESLQEVCIVYTLGVFFQNLANTHPLRHSERYERVGFRHGDDAERRGKCRQIVYTNRGPFSTSPDAEMQFFLVIHQGLNKGIILFVTCTIVHTANHCTQNHGPNMFETLIDDHGDVAIYGLQVRLSTLSMQKRSGCMCHGFWRE